MMLLFARPAVNGDLTGYTASGPHLQAAWTNGDHAARLITRLDSSEALLRWTTPAGHREAALTDLAYHETTFT
jgi:hypothetical protein